MVQQVKEATNRICRKWTSRSAWQEAFTPLCQMIFTLVPDKLPMPHPPLLV
jgi:hypothetical protein